MGLSRVQDDFLSTADAWLCDGYALDIRYIARPDDDAIQIVCASISMSPFNASENNSFEIVTEDLIAGQIQMYPVDKSELEGILKDAINGMIHLESLSLSIIQNSAFQYYSENTNQNSWYSDLHLQISGSFILTSLLSVSSKIDNDLRKANVPFDGLSDLTDWLGFERNILYSQSNKIIIRINPPVYLMFDECKLQEDFLKIVIHAHSDFELQSLGVAVRGYPAGGIVGRMQISQLINWGQLKEHTKQGTASVKIENCDNALVMLTVGFATVQRQWFLDSTKARNNRYTAIQSFDIELRQIRRALFELPDADKFEKGIGALLFLLGFSPMLQIETDAPDLIVTTPGGQLIIIECTIKVSDFSEKLGKLVERKGKLSKSLSDSGHQSEIFTVLITRSKKEEIVSRDEELNKYKVLLLTQEDIEALYNQIRNPRDPDKIINDQKINIEERANQISL